MQARVFLKRVGEVVSTSGLAEATCFRMLGRLELEGMLDRDPHSKKYFLGPLLHELGLLARPRYRLAELCDASLQRLADSTLATDIHENHDGGVGRMHEVAG